MKKTYIAPSLICFSVVALALGGVGGSLQLSRLFLLLLLPIIATRLVGRVKVSLTRYQRSILIFTILLAVYSTFSLAWSINRSITYGYLLVLFVNLTPLVMIGLMNSREINALRWLIPKAWLACALLILPIAMYEIVTGEHFELGLEERGGGVGIRDLPFASGLHGNYNDFSLFILFSFFGILTINASIKNGRNIKFDGTWIVASASICLVLLYNSSRAAITSFVAFIILKYLFPLRPRTSLLLVGLLFIVWCATIFILSDDNLLTEYLQIKFTDISSDLENDGGRWSIILDGISGVGSNFGLGVGVGNSSEYLATATGADIPNPHNLLLEWGMNFGFPGLVLLAWFLKATLRATFSMPRGENRRLIFAFIFLAPLYGVIQSHLTGYTYLWLAICTAIILIIDENLTVQAA